jgi:hypothetical protein
MPRSVKWRLSFWFYYQNCCASLAFSTRSTCSDTLSLLWVVLLTTISRVSEEARIVTWMLASGCTVDWTPPTGWHPCILIEMIFIICCFGGHCFSSSGYIASNERTINEYELQRMWKLEALNQFKVQSRHLPAGTQENHERPPSV